MCVFDISVIAHSRQKKVKFRLKRRKKNSLTRKIIRKGFKLKQHSNEYFQP